MKLSCCSLSLRLSVSKREFLLVTVCTRLFSIERHTPVVKQSTAQLHFGGAHRIVGRNGWSGKGSRYVPLEFVPGQCQKAKRQEEYALKHGRRQFERYRSPRGSPACDAGQLVEERQTSPELRTAATFRGEAQ